MIRVLIVDDSAVMRKALSVLLTGVPGIEVAGTAVNGEDALAKLRVLRPDVVTLDVEMPVMDGLTTLCKIRLLPEPRPAVLMCSTLTTAGSRVALKALRMGAADFIAKDPGAIGAGQQSVREDLAARIKAIAPAERTRVLRSVPAAPSDALPPREFQWGHRTSDLIVIGSSTGGPPILEEVLSALPANIRCPVVIAQHMPALFTASMSERLADVCNIGVVHADQDMLLEPGAAYVTVGGKHARVHRLATGRFRVEVSGKPEAALYKPSVNELFSSAAKAARERVLGIMLTGMGDDGCIGARELHAAGGLLLAQAPETCAVYGMPRAVVEAGLVQAILEPAVLGQVAAKGVSPQAKAA